MHGPITSTHKRSWVIKAAIKAHNARSESIERRWGVGPLRVSEKCFAELFDHNNIPNPMGVTHVYIGCPTMTNAVQLSVMIYDYLAKRRMPQRSQEQCR